MSLTSRALRRALATGTLGPTDLVFDGTERRNVEPGGREVEEFAAFVERALADAPDNGGFTQVDVVAGAEVVKLVAVASFEVGAEDFGESAVNAERREPHSVVELATGLVYLPSGAADGGAEKKYGARCSVLVPSSWRRALSEQTGALRPFQGGAAELVALGVPVDEPNAWGETALMQVASSASDAAVSLMEWLLSRGADPNRTAQASGCTALHLCVQSADDDEALRRVSLLVRFKANASAANKWGVTPLHITAYRGLRRTSAALVAAGADRAARDASGRLPTDLASEAWCERSIDGSSQFSRELQESLRV